MSDHHDGSREQFDEDGNPVHVANLTFVEGILGKGSYGVVRLARRRADATEECAVLGSSKSFDDGSSSGEEGRRKGVPRSASADALLQYTDSESGVYGKRDSDKLDNMTVASNATDSGDSSIEDKHLVAVKVFQKSILKRNRTMERNKTTRRMQIKTALQNVEREIALMKKLRHPNLVRFFEAIDSPESDLLYMVIEHMPLGEILTYQNDGTFRRRDPKTSEYHLEGVINGHFDEFHAAVYFVDIMHGLAYLHQHHVCHRDLKPENILISARGIAKLADFGISHMFDKGETFEDESESSNSLEIDGLTRDDTDAALNMQKMPGDGLLTKTEGTWAFWSPEMCEGGNFSGYAADLWAAGVCLYIFVTGKLPFYSEIPCDLFEVIKDTSVPLEGLGLSDNVVEMIKMTLEKDPENRAGVGDCLKHPFLLLPRAQRIQELSVELARSKSTNTVVEEYEVKSAFRTVALSPVVLLRSATRQLHDGFQAAKRRLSNKSIGSSCAEKIDRFKKKNSFDLSGHLSWTTGNSSLSGNGSLNESFSGHDDSLAKLGNDSTPALPSCIVETTQECEFDFEDVMQEMSRQKQFRKGQESCDYEASHELTPENEPARACNEAGTGPPSEDKSPMSRMLRWRRNSDPSDQKVALAARLQDTSSKIKGLFRRRSDIRTMSIDEESQEDPTTSPLSSPQASKKLVVPQMLRSFPAKFPRSQNTGG